MANKPPIYSDPATEWLMQCSKAALVDGMIELLRIQSGRCDDPVSEKTAQAHMHPVLRSRGDSVRVAYVCERPT